MPEERVLSPLENRVANLIRQFDYAKIRLEYEDGCGEGIWAVPADEESCRRYHDDSSYGEACYFHLCNNPLGFADLFWGDKVVAWTRGDTRPDAFEKDQERLKEENEVLRKERG